MVFTKQKAKLLSILKSLSFRSPKRSRLFFVLALVLVVFLFPLAQHALAQSAPKIGTTLPSAVKGGVDSLANVGSFFIVPILEVITWFCALLVDLAAHFLSFMLQPNLYNFTTEPIIVTGWIMVRDICNLFFLLILLFIAFCTILQIEKYHLKKNLLTLVIMALLINFSKPIAIFIFDGAQLLMNYFLGANQNYGTTITNLSGIADIVYKDLPGFIQTVKTLDFSGAAIQYLFAIIFMFMYAVALFVIGIYLVIRIVALWLIVIISPLAFLAMAVPDFKKMSNEWWDALFKYSYVGPAMAFFLWLSTNLAKSFFVTAAKRSNDSVAMGVGSVLSMGSFISFATVIVFLYASIIIAQKFGIQFASAITGYADKAIKMGTGLAAAGWGAKKVGQGAKYAATAGLKKFDRDVLDRMGVSPVTWVQAWKKIAEEREADIKDSARARAMGKLDKFFGRKKPVDFHDNKDLEERVGKADKEQLSISDQDSALFGVLDQFAGNHSDDAQARTISALRLLFRNNDQNELMKRYILNNPEILQEIKDKTGKTLNSTNPEDLKEALKYVLGRVGIDKENDPNQLGRQLHQLGNIALSKGNLSNYGMGNWDPKLNNGKGGFRESTLDEQAILARGKARNIDAQQKMKTMHWNSLFNEGELIRDAAGNVEYELDADGNIAMDAETGRAKPKTRAVGALHEAGRRLLANLTQAEIKQVERARGDFIQSCYAQQAEILAYANELSALGDPIHLQEALNVKAFHAKIIKQMESPEAVAAQT